MPTNTLWKGGSLPVWNLTPALLWRLLVSPWVNLAAGCDLQRNFPLSKYSSIEIISTPLLNELKKWNTLMLCDTCKALVWRRSRPHRLCIVVSYQSQIELNSWKRKYLNLNGREAMKKQVYRQSTLAFRNCTDRLWVISFLFYTPIAPRQYSATHS